MAALFKVDGLDLSIHLRVNQGDGLDPYGQTPLEPQFAEGALSDGDLLLSIREDNRQQVWQVILNPAAASYTASKDGLHQLIRDIGRVLKNATTIEWRDDGATNSTFFDVQFARFDPAWDFRRSQKLWVPGAIKAWTRPYGHTGTTRTVATAAGTQPIVLFSVASGALNGDADAQALTVMSLPSGQHGRLFAGLAVAGTDLIPLWPAASIVNAATLVGASGAFASQAARSPVIGVGAVGLLTLPLGATSHPNRQLRAIALARTTAATTLASALCLYAYMTTAGATAGAIGATQILPTGRGWRVVDLGTFGGGTSILGTLEQLAISGGLLSASLAATSVFEVGAVLYLPEGRAVAISQPSARIFPNPVATFTFDGLIRRVSGQDGNATGVPLNAFSFDEVVRGDYPQIPVGSARQVVAFAIPDDAAQNSPVSVEIRCRERFTFSR